MKKSEFKIGSDFFTASGRWMCTDIGRRTIIAIKKDMTDKSWYNGPPYAVGESVFDEYDVKGCLKTYKQAEASWGAAFVKAEKKRGKIVTIKVQKKLELELKSKLLKDSNSSRWSSSRISQGKIKK